MYTSLDLLCLCVNDIAGAHSFVANSHRLGQRTLSEALTAESVNLGLIS